METGKETHESLRQALSRLIDTEDYFRFFGVPFDAGVVHVNRLHILRKFGELKDAIDSCWPGEADETRKFQAYRAALEKGYETFLHSTAKDEKLFKVFREQGNPINVTFTLPPRK